MKRTYSIKEAAAELGVSAPTIYELINSNEIQSFKLRNRRFISANAIDQFIEKSEAKAALSSKAGALTST